LTIHYDGKHIIVFDEHEKVQEGYPRQAVQVRTLASYSSPPFEVRSSRFRTALTAAVGAYGEERLEALQSLQPSRRFLKLLGTHWTNTGNS
jgi:hypothetical protein